MKKTTAANIALMLVVAGWLLMFIGVVSQMGTPSPSMSAVQLEENRHLSLAALLLGSLSLLGGLWLAGYSFLEARARSIVS